MDRAVTATAGRERRGALQPERRPRLLFLARPFPPARRSSSTRTWNIAKQLARLGWDVTVVTPDPSVWREIDNAEEVEAKLKQEGIKRILTNHRWRSLAHKQFNYWDQWLGWMIGGASRVAARSLGFDDGVGWISAAEQACSALSKGDVDVILATSSPPSAFRLAKKLSARLGCPYVMDYRDPWTQNPHRDKPALPRHVNEEAQLLSGSAAVTIVSPSWAENLQRQHSLGPKLRVVSNGYDAEDFARVKPIDFGHFAVVYAGIFYPPKRVITPVMRALKQVQERSNGIRGGCYFHYYGRHTEHVVEESRQAGVTDRVVVHGEVSRGEALSAVKGAGLNVVITSVDDHASLEERGIVTGKIFDGVGLGTPILLICPAGGDAEIVIDDTKVGKAFRGSEIEDITHFIFDLAGGRSLPRGNPEKYSWEQIGRTLDVSLRSALESGK